MFELHGRFDELAKAFRIFIGCDVPTFEPVRSAAEHGIAIRIRNTN